MLKTCKLWAAWARYSAKELLKRLKKRLKGQLKKVSKVAERRLDAFSFFFFQRRSRGRRNSRGVSVERDRAPPCHRVRYQKNFSSFLKESLKGT